MRESGIARVLVPDANFACSTTAFTTRGVGVTETEDPDLVEQLFQLAQADPLALGGFVLTLASLIAAIAGLYYARIPIKKALAIEREQNARFGYDYIDRDEARVSLQYYVEPDCSSVDPSGEDDLRALIPSRQPAYRFLEEALRPASKYRHLLVLAESGMGKTSLLLNVLSRNASLPRRKRQRMLFVPLGRPNVLQQIEKAELKSETTLLLDAFDEDTQAVADHRARMKEIMDATASFRRVIITCRTQFFTRDEEIPRETGVMKVGPREGGEAAALLLYKMYLDPFDDQQVSRWIWNRFGFFRLTARRKALDLVRRVPELSVRPMLLTVIPDLIRDQKDIENQFELYEYMVNKWVERERSWIDPELLLEFSRKVALDIFTNRAARQSERMPFDELGRHMQNAPAEDGWKFKSRSLLNRDGDGNFKFAHRSIMEFLFVDAYLRGELSCLEVEWTDLMIELFWKAVKSSLDGRGRRLRESIFFDEDVRTAGIMKEGLRLGSLKAWSDGRSQRRHGQVDQYAGLFLRLGWIEGSMVVCDLLRNLVYFFVVSGDGSVVDDPFPVGVVDIENQRRVWAQGRNLGLAGWRMPRPEEIGRLFLFERVRECFAPHGVQIWTATDDESGLAVVRCDGRTAEVRLIAVANHRERIQSDPMLRGPQVKASVVMIATVDAESFYFNRIQSGEYLVSRPSLYSTSSGARNA